MLICLRRQVIPTKNRNPQTNADHPSGLVFLPHLSFRSPGDSFRFTCLFVASTDGQMSYLYIIKRRRTVAYYRPVLYLKNCILLCSKFHQDLVIIDRIQMEEVQLQNLSFEENTSKALCFLQRFIVNAILPIHLSVFLYMHRYLLPIPSSPIIISEANLPFTHSIVDILLVEVEPNGQKLSQSGTRL